jgi:hypothetical protein
MRLIHNQQIFKTLPFQQKTDRTKRRFNKIKKKAAKCLQAASLS